MWCTHRSKHTVIQVVQGKRSFQRAQRRASKHRYTWRRGKLFSAKQLGTSIDTHEPIHTHAVNSVPHGRRHRQRITCFSWNSGGMGAEKWDLFQIWLAQQQIGVVCLQETKWPFSSEWAQQHYHVVHSGNTGRSAGLMCMVSKQLCSTHELSWHEPIPGRLLHVRVHGVHRSLDILNIYQHVHAPHRLDERSEVWHQLLTLLDNLPRRNTVMLLGDMKHFPSSTYRCSGTGHVCAESAQMQGTQTCRHAFVHEHSDNSFSCGTQYMAT